jgi:AcrR family transcriptional regulator
MARAAAKPRADTRSPDHPRRQEILNAAARLFAERGYAGVLMEDIADELGMLKGSLYYWVDSKEELLKECLSRPAVTRHVARAEEIRTLPISAAERLRLLIRTQVESWTEVPHLFLLSMNEYRWLGPDVRDEYAGYQRRVDDAYVGVLRDGLAAGDFAFPGEDAVIVTKGLTGLINSFPRWFDTSGWASARYVADRWADMVLAGLRPTGLARASEHGPK